MFKRSMHRRLVKSGAPVLPQGYYYYPRVVFPSPNSRLLRMEIRKSHGLFGSTEVARWTVDPDTYFNDSLSTSEHVFNLCVNAARLCDQFVIVEG